MNSENPTIKAYQWIELASENVPPIITTSENPPIEERYGLED